MVVGVFMSDINREELLLKGTRRPRWRGQYMTAQQEGAKLYMARFPRVVD